LVARVEADQPAQLARLDGSTTRTLCTGKLVEPWPSGVAVTVRLAIDGTTARVARDDVELLTCDLEATDRGAWGVAAIGAGARVAVDHITVARSTALQGRDIETDEREIAHAAARLLMAVATSGGGR
jgi:hypothetical protein